MLGAERGDLAAQVRLAIAREKAPRAPRRAEVAFGEDRLRAGARGVRTARRAPPEPAPAMNKTTSLLPSR
jgi:hypothetical protein